MKGCDSSSFHLLRPFCTIGVLSIQLLYTMTITGMESINSGEP